jgi:hypothetical protein
MLYILFQEAILTRWNLDQAITMSQSILLSTSVLACSETPPPPRCRYQTLRLSRTFGYSSGTGDIQGTFTIGVSGPENLTRVIFYIDDEVMGEVVESPFVLRFRTGDYTLGVHTLKAVGYTSAGAELQSKSKGERSSPQKRA